MAPACDESHEGHDQGQHEGQGEGYDEGHAIHQQVLQTLLLLFLQQPEAKLIILDINFGPIP